jgi:hypothetical protein
MLVHHLEDASEPVDCAFGVDEDHVEPVEIGPE